MHDTRSRFYSSLGLLTPGQPHLPVLAPCAEVADGHAASPALLGGRPPAHLTCNTQLHGGIDNGAACAGSRTQQLLQQQGLCDAWSGAGVRIGLLHLKETVSSNNVLRFVTHNVSKAMLAALASKAARRMWFV
jgi:hypothetical protein